MKNMASTVGNLNNDQLKDLMKSFGGDNIDI